MACRMQYAGTGIRHVRHDGNHLQRVGEAHCSLFASLGTEGEYAADAVRHILLSQLVILAALKSGIFYPFYLLVVFQIFCNLQRVLAVARNSQMQCLKPDIGQKRILRVLSGAHIAHELCRSLGDIRLLSKTLRIYNAVVGLAL